MPRASDPVELRAAGVLQYCTGETVEPYDHCPRCGDFHQVRADPNGRFDFGPSPMKVGTRLLITRRA